MDAIKQSLLSVAPRYEEEMNDEINLMTKIIDYSLTTKDNEAVSKHSLNLISKY